MEPTFDSAVPLNRLHFEDANEDLEEASSPETGSRGAPEEIDLELLDDLQEDLALSTGELTVAESLPTLPEKSPFVTYSEPDGRVTIVRKSTLCWLLDSNIVRLSSDRLLRVQAKDLLPGLPGEEACNEVTEAVRKGSLSVGEWCIFKLQSNGEVVVGIVLSFVSFYQK